MKHIILMRHGKSSWEYEVSDKDRPLKERGIDNTLQVAGAFKDFAVKIDAAYSSPANRALHTAVIFLRKTRSPLANLRIEEALYDFSGESIQNFVKSIDNTHNTIALFGHNYAFTILANAWGDRHIEEVPTSGLVHIAFRVDHWADIVKGTTKYFTSPELLNS